MSAIESDGSGLAALIAALVILLIIGCIALVFKCAFILVPERRTALIERMGKFHKQCAPGIHFIMPVIDRYRQVHWVSVYYENLHDQVAKTQIYCKGMIDIREYILDFEKQVVITGDKALIEIDAVIYYKISDPRLAVLRCINLPYYLKLLAKATLRDIIAKLALDDLISSREFINDYLLDRLEENCLRIGITITRVEVQNILLDRVIADSMVQQLQAERRRRSYILTAEGTRDSSVIQSAGDATASVILSEAKRQTSVLQASSRAKCKLSKAAADAQCLAYLMEQLKNTGSSVKAYQFMLKIRYINQLRQYPKFENVVFGPTKGFVDLQQMGRK